MLVLCSYNNFSPQVFLRNTGVKRREKWRSNNWPFLLVQLERSSTQNTLPSSCSFGTRVKTFGRERGALRRQQQSYCCQLFLRNNSFSPFGRNGVATIGILLYWKFSTQHYSCFKPLKKFDFLSHSSDYKLLFRLLKTC